MNGNMDMISHKDNLVTVNTTKECNSNESWLDDM